MNADETDEPGRLVLSRVMLPGIRRTALAMTSFTLFAALACYRTEEDAAEEVCAFPGDSALTVEDGSDQEQEFVAGEPLKISASFLVGVDIKTRELGCTAIVDGDRITIETTYEWKGHGGSDALRNYLASCQTPALPAGSYVLKYGTEEKFLTVPSSAPAPCLSAE